MTTRKKYLLYIPILLVGILSILALSNLNNKLSNINSNDIIAKYKANPTISNNQINLTFEALNNTRNEDVKITLDIDDLKDAKIANAVPEIELNIPSVSKLAIIDGKETTPPEPIKIELVNEKNEVIKYWILNDSNNWTIPTNELSQAILETNTKNYKLRESEMYDGQLDNWQGTINNTELEPGNEIVFRNTYVPLADFSVKKIWDDNNNIANKRPESITYKLTGSNGDVFEGTVSSAENWAYTFYEMPTSNSKTGDPITYTLTEEFESEYYTSKIELITDEELYKEYQVTNTYVIPNTTIDIEATKIWDDLDNKYKLRPESITLLLKDNTGTVIEEKEVNESTSWKTTFTVPQYNSTTGEEITYTIDEKETLEYYEKTINNYIITNKIDELGVLGMLEANKDPEDTTPSTKDETTNTEKNPDTGDPRISILITCYLLTMIGTLITYKGYKKYNWEN